MRKRLPTADFAALIFCLMAALYFLGHYIYFITG